ncbi:MAG: hypothetical protein EGQ16_07685 [Clostridiales bacterium]|nr:hypothetical protein [Clostridiales bacterium]
MKSKIFIIVILQIIIMIGISFNAMVMAKEEFEIETISNVKIADVIDPTKDIGAYDKVITDQSSNKVMDMGNKIIGAIQLIGSIVSVLTLVVLGIKYMAGSVEERAEYKKTMMPYVVGAVMVFAITNLLKILENVISGMV